MNKNSEPCPTKDKKSMPQLTEEQRRLLVAFDSIGKPSRGCILHALEEGARIISEKKKATI